MSKFIVPPGRLAGLFPSARSLTAAGRRSRRLLQGLDTLADLGRRGRIELELQELLVRADRHSCLAKRVGGLSEREERLLVPRPQPDDLLVRGDGLGRGGLVLRRGLLELRARLPGHRRGDRIRTQSLPELLGRGGPERRADARILLRERGDLGLAEEAVCLP